MRYVLLVALREFAENTKTKGFWLSITMFPVLIVLSIYVMDFLDKATPTRHYVLVDRSGEFEQVIEDGLERLHQRDVFAAVIRHAQKYAATDGAKERDLEHMRALDPDDYLDELIDQNAEVIDGLMAKGGRELALEQTKALTRPDAPEFTEPRRRFERIPLPAGVPADLPPDELVRALKPYLAGDRTVRVGDEDVKLFAAIIVPQDVDDLVIHPGTLESVHADDGRGVQYWSINLADSDLKDEVQSILNKEVRRREYVAREVDAGLVQAVERTRLPVASLNPKKEEGKEEVSVADVVRQWAPVGFVYLLWIAIFTVSQMLLNNTIEEKSNRIIEVLLSSVTADELMHGKLLGIAAVGLTMITAWIGSLVAVLAINAGPEAEIAVHVFEVLRTAGLLPFFVLYFLLGYLMYAGIFLAIGSLCNTLKEAQNLMGPVMMVMMIPLFTMMFIPKDPNGTLATTMSWIPIYTPFVMMNRAAADPPMFDVVGTLVLLVLATLASLWLTGKIFRIGILRTGQPPKLFELLRWVRG